MTRLDPHGLAGAAETNTLNLAQKLDKLFLKVGLKLAESQAEEMAEKVGDKLRPMLPYYVPIKLTEDQKEAIRVSRQFHKLMWDIALYGTKAPAGLLTGTVSIIAEHRLRTLWRGIKGKGGSTPGFPKEMEKFKRDVLQRGMTDDEWAFYWQQGPYGSRHMYEQHIATPYVAWVGGYGNGGPTRRVCPNPGQQFGLNKLKEVIDALSSKHQLGSTPPPAAGGPAAATQPAQATSPSAPRIGRALWVKPSSEVYYREIHYALPKGQRVIDLLWGVRPTQP